MNNIFRKIVLSASLSLFVVVGFVGMASAQGELLFGQNHFYTVVFRGNGEAVVYAKLAVTNPDEKPLTEFSFEVPKASPTEMAIYQMKLPQECTSYNYSDPARPCLKYRDPDYAQQYYYYGYNNGQAEYQKVQYTQSGNLYKLTLPTPVDPYRSTALIIAYAAKGYVSESFGLYSFNFETIKVPSRIQAIRVAVDVDSDLLLKGRQSSVNYNTSGLQSDALSAPSAVSGANLDKVVGQIGSYGPLVKEAKNLAPNESFNVKGEYATSWFRLYFGSLLLTIVIIVAIFAAIYFAAKFLKRRRRNNGQIDTPTNQGMAPQNPQNSSGMVNLTNISVGLLSVVLVVGLSYLVTSLSESSLFRSFNPNPVFGIVTVITMILLYVLVIFGPAITVAIKHGWKSLVAILIAEFLWFVIFLLVYLIFFQSGLTSTIFRGGVMY